MLLCLVTKHVFLQLDLGYMIRGDRNYARSSLQSAVLKSEKKKNGFDLSVGKKN